MVDIVLVQPGVVLVLASIVAVGPVVAVIAVAVGQRPNVLGVIEPISITKIDKTNINHQDSSRYAGNENVASNCDG